MVSATHGRAGRLLHRRGARRPDLQLEPVVKGEHDRAVGADRVTLEVVQVEAEALERLAVEAPRVALDDAADGLPLEADDDVVAVDLELRDATDAGLVEVLPDDGVAPDEGVGVGQHLELAEVVTRQGEGLAHVFLNSCKRGDGTLVLYHFTRVDHRELTKRIYIL